MNQPIQTYARNLIGPEPSSKLLWVDVKGLSTKNSWMITPKEPRDDLFYVLVLLSPLAEKQKKRLADRFFILTQPEVNEIEAAYRKAHPNDKGLAPGFPFSSPIAHEDFWDKLPR
jgi:hypothetical protein